jgi:hypothetical protein
VLPDTHAPPPFFFAAMTTWHIELSIGTW